MQKVCARVGVRTFVLYVLISTEFPVTQQLLQMCVSELREQIHGHNSATEARVRRSLCKVVHLGTRRDFKLLTMMQITY